MTTAIWWIRRDLRLTDSGALAAALSEHDSVLPLFILDDRLLNSPTVAPSRIRLLYHGLVSLDRNLNELGSGLVVREGAPERILHELVADHGISSIYAERSYTPFAKKRDADIEAVLPLQLTDGLTGLPFGTVLKEDQTPYRVFSAYAKRWKEQWQKSAPAQHARPASMPKPDIDFDKLNLLHERLANIGDGATEESASAPVTAGESTVNDILEAFTAEDGGVYRYDSLRDVPASIGTSGLSAYIRFGMISAADVVRAAFDAIERASDIEAKRSAERWLDEIIWREFYVDVMHHFPKTRRQNFNSDFDHLTWQNNEAEFAAWTRGKTGYPLVDAGMRQLAQSGWMHNRVRMVTASFLVKHLLVDWRWGERWFMQMLADGEPASNVGGWQWVAGAGVNAAPFFRIFNPTTQAKKYDASGDYIRRWVTELIGLPDEYIHQPWLTPESLQKECGCVIGKDYPAPIVDHKWARERALDAYEQMRHRSDA